MISKEEVTEELLEMLGMANALIDTMIEFHAKYEKQHKELSELNESDDHISGIYNELANALEELSA